MAANLIPITSDGGFTTAGNITTGNLTTTGNGTFGNISTSGADGNISGANVISANIFTATGNITGGNLITGGDLSVSGNSNIGNISTSGIVSATGNGTFGNIITSGSGGNISGANVISANIITASGNITGGNLITGGDLNVSGNSNIGNIGTSGIVSATGNGTFGNIITSGSGGNISGANIISANIFTASANITGDNITAITHLYTPNITNGATGVAFDGGFPGYITFYNSNGITVTIGDDGNINAVSNITGANLTTGGDLSVTGNATVGNLVTSGASGNISGANLISANTFSATGNITGDFFIGNGSQLTGITTSGGSSISNGNSNVNIATSNGNVTTTVAGNTTLTVTDTGANISGTLSATGNITVGNLTTSGASGNISGANIITANFFAGTLTTQAQPNITSTGTLSSLSVSGNSNIGNIGTGGLITATGNLNAGNIITPGIVSATGNVTGNFFIGNGSQLTGVATTAFKPSNLLYVAKNGNDSTGTGSINAPYLTLQAAITAANVAGAATAIVLAPGNYAENITITDQSAALNISGSGLSETAINGNVLVSGTSNNIEFDNLRIATGRVTHSSTGYLSVNNVRFSANTGFTKTSTNVAKFYNVDLGAAGTGNVLIQAGRFNFTNGQLFNVVISGSSTEVNLLQCDSVLNPTISAGSLLLAESIVSSLANSGANALTASGGTVNIKNSLFINPNRTIGKISIGASASYSYGDSAFDIANSTISGTAVVVPAQFQAINSTGNVTGANLIGPHANGNSNVNIATSNGNVTITAGGNTTLTITDTSANITGNLSVSGNSNVGNIGATGGIFTTITGSLTTANQPNITSTGVLTSLSVSGNITTGNLLVASRGAIGVAPQQEFHVSRNGSDTDGNGSITNPYRTIGYALTLVGGGAVIIVHPGEYTEDVTVNNLSGVAITAAQPGAATPQTYAINGNLVVSGTSGSVLLHSVGVVGNITHSSSGSFFVTTIQMGTGNNSTTFNKTGTGYLEVFNGDWSGGTPAVNVTGAGLVTFNGVQLTNLTVNNANASVILRNIPSANNTTLTSGTLTVISSTMVGNSNTAAAITTVAGTLNIQNSILLRANNTAGTMIVGASTAYLYDDIFFDRANSTLSGIPISGTIFAPPAEFQAIRADSLSVVGNITVGNISGANVISANLFTGTLTTASQPNITSIGTLTSLSVSGNSNIGNIGTGIITATGNITSANLITGGIVSATGNVTGNFFIGNGSQLTSVTALNANVSLVSNNQEYSPLLATNTTGNLPFRASAGISWNPSSYALTAGKILLGSGIGAQGVTGTYAFGANTAWKVQSQNGTNTDALGQEIGRFGSEYTSGATTFWDSYTSYYQGSGASSGWMILNAAGNSVANVTGTGIAVTGTLSATGNITGSYLISTNASGNEGGEISLAQPPNGNLSGGITIDAYQNTLRMFEQGGTSRGLSIDIANSPAGGGTAIGYRDIPQVAAGNVTLAATDAGKHYYSTTAGNLTLTIPLNSTVPFTTGTAISIVVQAAGNILVNAASGVTLYMAGNSTAANRVVGTYGMATLMKVATDTWFINGTGVA